MSRIAVVAPVPGTFTNHADGQPSPYVTVGATVHVGTVIGRLINGEVDVEIHAEVAGVVAELAAGDGDVVITGQALIIVATR